MSTSLDIVVIPRSCRRSPGRLTRLPDGRLLRDAIDADPAGYLGPGHVQRYGSSSALLVKLLDAGERLPVHCHPDDVFARRHLASAWGKIEAWIVLDAAPGSAVYLGFSEAVPDETLAGWVAGQAPEDGAREPSWKY